MLTLASAGRRLAGALALGAPLLLTACDGVTDTGGTPRRAVVTAVQIDDAPLVDVNGNAWDGAGGGGPEVYFRLFFADDDPVATPGADVLNPRDDGYAVARASDQPWYEDVAGADFPLVWDVDGGFDAGLRDEYRVVLFDYDPTTGDDVMISTEPFSFGDAAPDEADGREDTVVLEGVAPNENEVQVRLRVVYED